MRILGLTSDQWLQIVLLPLIFAAVGVIAKRLGRRDGDDSPFRNDWAIGTGVILMTFGKVAADLMEYKANAAPNNLPPIASEIFWWLFGMLLALFFFINHDRFGSWNKDATGTVMRSKRMLVGVVMPDIISVLIFASYQARKVGIL
jgi:hypothetical protein